MGQKEIIIKIQNDRILFNPQLSIGIDHTNIPYKYLTFRTNQDIYWKVEMLEYLSSEKCLKVKILDYYATDVVSFTNQPAKSEIKRLVFVGKYDWSKLYPLLISYTRSKFVNLLYNIDIDPALKIENEGLNNRPIEKAESIIFKPFEHSTEPVVSVITDDFWVEFNEAQFMLGYITFKKYIKRIRKNIDFKIPNDHILAEFGNIKYWFSKRLKTKKFHVKVSVRIIDNEVKETNATSNEIDLITPELIDSIKYLRTIALTKAPKENNLDKSLFTAEDIFSQIDTDDMEGNVFIQTEEDILNFLIEKVNVRNKKELAYLSGKKQSENHPIRYTLHPNFGFLFLIEGVENNHFVWELLNSNATYIWTIDKSDNDIKLQFKRIENIINTVRTNGREKYKNAYKNTHQDNDLIFRVINHKDIGSDLVDEFPRWKNKLNEQLT